MGSNIMNGISPKLCKPMSEICLEDQKALISVKRVEHFSKTVENK